MHKGKQTTNSFLGLTTYRVGSHASTRTLARLSKSLYGSYAKQALLIMASMY